MEIKEFMLLEQLILEEEQELEEAGFFDRLLGKKPAPPSQTSGVPTTIPAPPPKEVAQQAAPYVRTQKDFGTQADGNLPPVSRSDHLKMALKVGNQMIQKGASKVNEPKFFDQRVGHGQILEGMVNIYDLIAKEATNAPKAQAMASQVRDHLGAAYKALGLVAQKQ